MTTTSRGHSGSPLELSSRPPASLGPYRSFARYASLHAVQNWVQTPRFPWRSQVEFFARLLCLISGRSSISLWASQSDQSLLGISGEDVPTVHFRVIVEQSAKVVS